MKLALKHPKRKYLEAAAYIVLISAFSAKAFTDGLSPPSRDPSFDPLTSMFARSPGKRTAGELGEAKLALSKKPSPRTKVASRVSAASPRATAKSPAPLGEIRTPLGLPSLPIIDSPALIAAIAPPVGGFPVVDAIGAVSSPGFSGGGTGGGGGGGFAILPGGGGGGGGGGLIPPGGGGGGSVGVPPIDVLPLPAIPEPTTWAMMIMGFGFIGSILRRHRNLSPLRPRTRFL